MNEPTLKLVADEIAAALSGKRIGRIFQLSRLVLAFDIRGEGRFLFISADPTAPRFYLIERRLRDLEKQSVQQLAFAQFLKKRISGAVIDTVEKMPGERIVKIGLAAESELGSSERYFLAVQLTGRSSNLFLLDADGRILDRLRDTFGEGQEIATVYAPPERRAGTRADEAFASDPSGSISAALDAHYEKLAADAEFRQLANAARAKLKQASERTERLASRLRADLDAHGDPAIWKRFGDLLLANLADAVIENGRALVVDYFDESTPLIEIEIEPNDELTVAADKFFRKYTKARNARDEIGRRIAEIEAARNDAERRREELEGSIAARDLAALKAFLGRKPGPTSTKRGKNDEAPAGTRRFVSSDGFEILVGKGAKDNDSLTFRVARSADIWLHAADYPGSHVIIRNPARGDVPQRTLLEAARYAVIYSQAREHPKAAVHYTSRKNVHKPRGGAPGLVSLTNFKTIIVAGG